MTKILCVLYDDPINGYPTSYTRDDLPTIEHFITCSDRTGVGVSLSRDG